MGRRWKAFLALGLVSVMIAPSVASTWPASAWEAEEPPLAEAFPEEERLPEDEDGWMIWEAGEPAERIEDVRAVFVGEVPEEYRDAACYAVYRGLLETDGEFQGEEPVTRGEALQALYRLGGGVPEEYAAPDELVSRSQLAVMLYRFSQGRGDDMTCRRAVYSAEDVIPEDAWEAWDWVLDRGLYAGMTDHGLYPDLPVSRNQLAAALARMQMDRDPLAAELRLPENGESASRSRENHEALDQAVNAIAKRHGAVGVQVAVIEHGAVTDTYTYGWSVKGSTPMTDQHKMRVASLSKVMVGVSAALLEEEGVVDYDAVIGDYWGVEPRKPVTIRSMLTHTSTLLNSESLAWDRAGVQSQLVSASGYGGGTPGSLGYWSYNNHAFGILGQTLELASGRFLDDILQDRLLGYLGADGSFAAGELAHPELVSPLYRAGGSLGRSHDSLVSVRRWSSPGATGRQFAGGFTTSARDYAKLVAVLAGDGCFEGVRLMDADSVALMESHGGQALPGGTYQAMPMRLRFNTYGREGLYYHTGSAYGVYNLVSYDPFAGDGVVVLTMGAGGGKDECGIYAVCGEISRAVYDAIQ